jgi:hypothetical protein
MIAQTVLRHVQQGLSKPPKRRGLSFETADLGLDSSRQHIVGGFAAQLSELVFKMLLRLGGDMPDFLLTLEVGDELSGCAHPPTIEEEVVCARPTSADQWDEFRQRWSFSAPW